MNAFKKQNFPLKNVAFSLIGINVLMFIAQAVAGDGFTQSLLLVSGDIFARPWILLTSMFLHGSFVHLLFNMYALLIFGPLIENRIGSKRFLGIYLISGLLASFLYALFNTFIQGMPEASALGASGAVMAILGLVIMLLPQLKVLFFFVIPMSMRTAGIIFIAIDVFGMIGPSDGIAHLAHLAGVACGLLYGWYLLKKKKTFARSFQRGPRVKQYRFSTQNSRSSSPFQRKQQSSSSKQSYEDTIELSKDDVDNYFKYGKL